MGQCADPDCNGVVDEEKPIHSSDCDGKTFYFCSLECKEKFEKRMIAEMAEYLKR